jgi:hypothetical protein
MIANVPALEKFFCQVKKISQGLIYQQNSSAESPYCLQLLESGICHQDTLFSL